MSFGKLEQEIESKINRAEDREKLWENYGEMEEIDIKVEK